VINLSWQFYTGLPQTIYEYDFTYLENGDLHFYPRHLTFRGEEYPPYHRMDLKVNKRFNLKLGHLNTYLHLINLYNRHNLRKYDVDATNGDEQLVSDENGGYRYFRDDQYWLGITPAIGISWEFTTFSKSAKRQN
jgi:hypothetical protein